MEDAYSRARRIRLAVFDVDGVLTDGRLYYSDSGAEIKAFDVRDGHGLKMLEASGVRLAIITSRSSRAVELRAQNLGIQRLFQGVADKLAAFEALLAREGLEMTEASYMGDDLVDLAVLMRCGLAVAVPEAAQAVLDQAHYVTRAPGGGGAVREFCEMVMRAQGTFDSQLDRYRR